jgi:hypothetical protein
MRHAKQRFDALFLLDDRVELFAPIATASSCPWLVLRARHVRIKRVDVFPSPRGVWAKQTWRGAPGIRNGVNDALVVVAEFLLNLLPMLVDHRHLFLPRHQQADGRPMNDLVLRVRVAKSLESLLLARHALDRVDRLRVVVDQPPRKLPSLFVANAYHVLVRKACPQPS